MSSEGQRAGARRALGLESLVRADPGRGLALGLLAMAPLFLAYELALAVHPEAPRSTAELVLGLGLAPLGPAAHWIRRGGLVLALAAALVIELRRDEPLGPRLARCWIEGGTGALVLGPLLVGISALLGHWVEPIDASWTPPVAAPSLARAGRLLGGAAWEELLFRVGLYGALFLVARASLLRLGARLEPAAWIAEGVGLVGSSAAFAAIHLEVFVRWLGRGGEPFDASVLVWRLAAGMLLALLFRWRGPGVAAWTHALFNLGLELGSGVHVLQ